MNNIIELSIVMPCLNEEKTLSSCLIEAFHFLKESGIQGEVIVGDNGSTDRSVEIALSYGAKVVHVAEKGYGSVLLNSVKESRGRFIIIGDSDGSYDFSNLMPFMIELRKGHDLVMGNRFKGEIHEGAMPWKNKWIGNPVLSGIGRVLFKTSLKDFHCGIRGFTRECFDKLNLKTTGMEFASEMVIKSSIFGFKVTEIPVILRKDGRLKPSHLNPWRDGWRHLRLMLLFSPRWVFLFPGILLCVVGFFISLRLMIGSFKIGPLNFDINTLIVTGSMILIGFQAVCFAVFTKVFAIENKILPEDPRLNYLLKFINLERGLVIGSVIFFSGLAGIGRGVYQWGSLGFSDLDPQATVRIVYPSVISLVMGIQIFMASLFISILGLKRVKK